ncbi:hypothetical protein ACN6MS_16050 [Bacillus licheniformis]
MKLTKNVYFIISFLAAAGIYFLLGTVAASAANEDYPEQMIRLEKLIRLKYYARRESRQRTANSKTDERRKRRKMEA